jgi:glutaredoxin 3
MGDPTPQPRIIVYCTPWCPSCRSARQYLDRAGLRYELVDISKDSTAEKRARELGRGRIVTPTFDIEGTIILDFDRVKLGAVLGL